MSSPITWPEGKRFAFTVFDDTDRGTIGTVGEVYALLRDLGMRTTKSVWPIAGEREPTIPGDTCEDDAYREWTLALQRDGFEIGYHNATYHGVERADTERALDRFCAIYGADPRTAANHAENREAIYWGDARLTGPRRLAYRGLRGFRRGPTFRGHVDGDPCFWGDLCRDRITYVRNFVYDEIDTLSVCPEMPYHDPVRPYVNLWFASSEGGTARTFLPTIREANQDQLEEQGGACIMYTHFAKGFQSGGKLEPRFVELMTRLAGKNGWFVPTATLLDYLVEQRGRQVLSNAKRARLERRWIAQQVRRRVRALI